MASEIVSETSRDSRSSLEDLLNSTSRRGSFFFPLLGVHEPDSGEEDSESPEFILIDPSTRSLIVIRVGDSDPGDDSFPDEFFTEKSGQPPASKASIDALKSVDDSEGECVVCLEEWGIGEEVKEMPGRHRFHSNCINKWLSAHGSCPVCRHQMPVDEDESVKKMNSSDLMRLGSLWLSLLFSVADSRRNDEEEQGEIDHDHSESEDHDHSDSEDHDHSDSEDHDHSDSEDHDQQ